MEVCVMKGLYDEDGIDGPFQRAMRRAMKDDAKAMADAKAKAAKWAAKRAAACPICAQVGGPLVRCTVCGQLKGPFGRDVGVQTANSYCGWDCPGYTQEPRPDSLWPGEKYGDSLGHMDWHDEAKPQP